MLTFFIYLFQGGSRGQRSLRSKALNLVLVPSLSDPDCTTCLMETEAGSKKTLIVSLYCDINKEIITNTMLNIINYRNRTGAELYIQCDSNAHSDLWGCAETNTRGNELETFLYENDLVVQNMGATPTFVSSRGKSIIDLTITSGTIGGSVKDWEVIPDLIDSDHRLIKFKINSNIELINKKKHLGTTRRIGTSLGTS